MVSAVVAAQNPAMLGKVLDVRAPIAISASGGGAYFIASEDGTVFEYKNLNGALRYDRQCGLPAFYRPTDITGSKDGNGSPVVFVTAWSSVNNRGMIARCTESGSSMTIETKFTQDIPVSIASSSNNPALYYVLARYSELHQVGFDLNNDKSVAELSSVQRPGPMTVSPDARYLFVADMNDRKIVQIDLQGPRNSRTIASAIGYPSALSYDPNTGLLYAADFSARQVLLVDVLSAHRGKLNSIRSPLFKGIEGLAPGPAGGLLIADNKANAVFLWVDVGATNATRIARK